MKQLCITFIAILLAITNIYSVTIKGKILDDKGKPFSEDIGIITITNTLDGTQEIQKHKVDKSGNYSITTNNIGYWQLLVGVDTMDKFLCPIWTEKGKNYNLNISLPHTALPYVSMSQAKLKSTNKDLVKNIITIDSLLNCVDLCAVYFSEYIVNNAIEEYLDKISEPLNYIIKTYKETKDNGVKFIAGICYINSLSCLTPLQEKAVLDFDLLNDFTKKYDYKTEYFYTMNINWINVALLYPEEFEATYIKDMQKNNSIAVKSEILAQATAYYYDIEQNKEKSAIYFEQLQKDFQYLQNAMLAKQKYDPNKQIQIGKQLPHFEWESLDDNSIKLNNEYFKDKYLLIHFWHTDAPENNIQINEITSSLSEFFDKNYEVLSISLDKTEQTVIDYRLNINPMKWNHIVDYEQGAGTIGKTFELYKLPFYILVAPDGTIIALDDELAPPNLLETLNKYIK